MTRTSTVRLPDGSTIQTTEAPGLHDRPGDDELREELLDAAGAPLPDYLKRTGRPSLTAPGQHSPQVGFRVPADLQVAAQAEASRRGVSVSALARLALAEFLTQQEQVVGPPPR